MAQRSRTGSDGQTEEEEVRAEEARSKVSVRDERIWEVRNKMEKKSQTGEKSQALTNMVIKL